MARAKRRRDDAPSSVPEEQPAESPGGIVAFTGHFLSLRCGTWKPETRSEHRHPSGQISIFGDSAEGEVSSRGRHGRSVRRSFVGSEVWLVPPGVRHAVRHRKATQFLVISPTPAFWKEITRGVPLKDASLVPMRHYIGEDPFIGDLIALFWKYCRSGEFPRRAYLEMASGLLALHIVAVHLAPRQREDEADIGLPAAILNRVITFMREHYGEKLDRDILARHAGFSRWHFSRLFAASMKMPPMQFLNEIRVEEAKKRLQAGGKTVLQIAVEVGFCDAGQLGLHFKRKAGVTPGVYLKQAARARRPIGNAQVPTQE